MEGGGGDKGLEVELLSVSRTLIGRGALRVPHSAPGPSHVALTSAVFSAAWHRNFLRDLLIQRKMVRPTADCKAQLFL